MGFLSKIFGTDLESEKRNKFQEIERQFVGDFKMANLAKICWLMSRGNHLMQENKTNEAINDFRDILEINPEEIGGFECLMGLYSIKKDYANAGKVLMEFKEMFKQSKNDKIKVQSIMIDFYVGMLFLGGGKTIEAVMGFYAFLKEVENITKNPIWQKLLQDDETMKKDKKLLQDNDIIDKSASIKSEHEERVSFAKDTLMRMKNELSPETQKVISQVL